MWEERKAEWRTRGKRGESGVMDSRREERLLELRKEEGESLLPSIFTGSELLNRELELERVPKTLQIQLHLETKNEETEREITWNKGTEAGRPTAAANLSSKVYANALCVHGTHVTSQKLSAGDCTSAMSSFSLLYFSISKRVLFTPLWKNSRYCLSLASG